MKNVNMRCRPVFSDSILRAEGPIGQQNGTSYLANYRYSTLSVLNKIGVNLNGDASIDFQDGAFKVYIPYDDKVVVSVWGMGGLSTSKVDDEDFKERFKSNRGMVGVNYLRYINSKSYMENTVSYSATSQTGDFYDKNIEATYQQKFVNQSLRLSSLYNYKINARNTVRLGSDHQSPGFQFCMIRTMKTVPSKSMWIGR